MKTLPALFCPALAALAFTLATSLAPATSSGEEPTAPEWYSRLDRNGDGKITREEIPRIFDEVDADGDGVASMAELIGYFAKRREETAPDAPPPADPPPAQARSKWKAAARAPGLPDSVEKRAVTIWSDGTRIDVLGRYLEAVAGKPLDGVLRERILGPLKMSSTDFWVHPGNAGRICQIYRQPRPGVLERGREASQLTEKPTLFLGGQGLVSSAEDYERFCRMMMNRGELDGVRVLRPESVDLMFQNHLEPEIGQRYGLGGAVDGEGGYSWGGANGTQFWLDRSNQFFGIFMVQTQRYRAPTYGTFRALANEAAGIASRGGTGGLGQGGAGTLSRLFLQRDADGDGKLSRDELPAALFERLDADMDGFVSEEEFKALRQQ